MRIKNPLLRQRIFYFLLAFCLFSLPFPDYSLNTKALIGLAVYWAFFYNSLKEKKKYLQKHFLLFLSISSFFWVPVLGLFYTDNLEGAISEIQLKLPFLILPLIFFSVPFEKSRAFLMDYFVVGVIAASFLALIKIWYFKLNHLGEYFHYARFADFLDRHTTYYALLVVIALLWLLWTCIKKKHNQLILFATTILLLYVLYLLSVRASIIALLGGFLIIVSTARIKKSIKFGGLLIIPCLLALVYFTPHFQSRFDLSTTDTTAIHDFDYRKLHWKSVKETIEHQSLIFGNGTYGNRDFLYEKYKEYGLTAAYKLRYNAHNQLLETVLEFGIIGALIFVGVLLYFIYFLLRHRDYFALSVLTIFLLFMITESIFQRTIGVVFFSVLMCIFLRENSTDDKDWKKLNNP